MKILIINDYIDKIGGIETHIYDLKEALEQNGYEVKIIGFKGKNKLFKYILYILSFFNIFGYFYLLYVIKKYKPDIIRYHSILRAWGFLVLLVKVKKKIITYHDRGLFAPRAYDIKYEEDILRYKHIINWIKEYKLFGLIKYIKTYIIIKLLKNIDIHIVPSYYMKDVLKEYNINAKVLNHFIKCEKF